MAWSRRPTLHGIGQRQLKEERKNKKDSFTFCQVTDDEPERFRGSPSNAQISDELAPFHGGTWGSTRQPPLRPPTNQSATKASRAHETISRHTKRLMVGEPKQWSINEK